MVLVIADESSLHKSQIALLGMLHLVYGTNSPLISASLVRQSPALSPITHGSSSSSPSSLPPLASSLTRYQTDYTDSRTI